MALTLKRLLIDEDGQDLVEYALLVAFVGLACLAAWLAFEDGIAAGYISFDTAEQDLGAVTPPPQ